jgi:hypothetical protein
VMSCRSCQQRLFTLSPPAASLICSLLPVLCHTSIHEAQDSDELQEPPKEAASYRMSRLLVSSLLHVLYADASMEAEDSDELQGLPAAAALPRVLLLLSWLLLQLPHCCMYCTQMPLWRLRTAISGRGCQQRLLYPVSSCCRRCCRYNYLIAACIVRRCLYGG